MTAGAMGEAGRLGGALGWVPFAWVALGPLLAFAWFQGWVDVVLALASASVGGWSPRDELRGDDPGRPADAGRIAVRVLCRMAADGGDTRAARREAVARAVLNVYAEDQQRRLLGKRPTVSGARSTSWLVASGFLHFLGEPPTQAQGTGAAWMQARALAMFELMAADVSGKCGAKHVAGLTCARAPHAGKGWHAERFVWPNIIRTLQWQKRSGPIFEGDEIEPELVPPGEEGQWWEPDQFASFERLPLSRRWNQTPVSDGENDGEEAGKGKVGSHA